MEEKEMAAGCSSGSPFGSWDLEFVPKMVGLRMYTTLSKMHTACKLLPAPTGLH